MHGDSAATISLSLARATFGRSSSGLPVLFQKQWPLYWTEEERGLSPPILQSALLPEMLCPNPVAFVRCAGVEQVRASRAVVRVIYFTRTAEGEVVLLTLYAKAKTDNLTGPKLKEIRRAIEE